MKKRRVESLVKSVVWCSWCNSSKGVRNAITEVSILSNVYSYRKLLFSLLERFCTRFFKCFYYDNYFFDFETIIMQIEEIGLIIIMKRSDI